MLSGTVWYTVSLMVAFVYVCGGLFVDPVIICPVFELMTGLVVVYGIL